MKKLKHIFITAAIFASSTFLTSCNNDDDNNTYFSELGTVDQTTTSGTSWIVNGDIYGSSLITNSNVLTQTKTDSIGQRILYYFVEEKDNSKSDTSLKKIAIFDLYKVLTKKVDLVSDLTEEVKGFGSDPIYITGAYASEKHLNIRFQVGGSNANIKHRISLVGLSESMPDEEGVINMELCHNANKDIFLQNKWGYVSYTLESIPGYNEGKLKAVKITYKTSDNEEKTITVKVNEKASTLSAIDSKATSIEDIN